MTHDFDPGYGADPYRTLCQQFPGPEVSLTVVDDADFLSVLATELNLPAFVKEGLPELY